MESCDASGWKTAQVLSSSAISPHAGNMVSLFKIGFPPPGGIVPWPVSRFLGSIFYFLPNATRLENRTGPGFRNVCRDVCMGLE